ncbi:MAG: Hsp33 family molecular chaperone HslO [Spirochaetales bacterium]
MHRYPIENPQIERHLDSIAEDGIDLFMIDNSIRGALLHGTSLVNAMRANHGLGIMETLILGHAYCAVGLMASTLKEHGRIGINMECSGPVEGIAVEGTARGEIRGYLQNPSIPITEEPESFDTSDYIGVGRISVTRYLESRKHPFTGQVLIEHGRIARDLANYYLQSEQTPAAFNLSVKFDRAGNVIGAGGLFAQAMPEADKDTRATVEDRISQLPSLGNLFSDGRTGSEILRNSFDDLSLEIIGTRTAEFFCHCSKERFARFLAALPEHEREDMKETGPFPLRTTCHNCNSTYEFTREEVIEIADRVRTRS